MIRNNGVEYSEHHKWQGFPEKLKDFSSPDGQPENCKDPTW